MSTLRATKQGFTMVELLVIVGIIGLGTGVVMTTFKSLRERENLNNASKATVAWLDDLRRKAIQKSVPCRATWNIKDGSISGQCVNETKPSSTLNIDPISTKKGQRISINLGESPTTWIFTPRGTSTTAAEAIFTLPNSDEAGRCLKLTAPLGLIRSAKRKSTGSCDYTTSF